MNLEADGVNEWHERDTMRRESVMDDIRKNKGEVVRCQHSYW